MNARVNNLTGLQGGTVIANTSIQAAPSGEAWHAVLVVEETVLAAYAGNLTGDSLVGKILPVGFVLYGKFTSLTLSSGSVIAYLQ